jgi:glycosyltransferase involved in cell wall biosynthesis
MKILFLDPIGEIGGAERCLLDLMYALRNAQPEIGLRLICGTTGPLVEEARELGVEASVLTMPRDLVELGDSGLRRQPSAGAYLKFTGHALSALVQTQIYAAQVARSVSSFPPDLIHSNGMKFHVLSRVAGFSKIPVLFHLRDFVRSRPLASYALRWAARRASHLVAVSHAIAAEARKEFSSTPVSVIYDAIDVEEFHPLKGKTADLDDLAGLPAAAPGTVRIGLVATYARWKGHHVFLDAAARVMAVQSTVPLRFYIVGGSIYKTTGSQVSEPELRQRASALGLEGHVGFIGFQKAIADVYRSLDIVVHASTEPEPFGRTIVEPMACCRPVIVSAAGGAAELFTNKIDAIGVAPGDAAGLALAISELVENPAERQRLGKQARSTVVERFSRGRLASDMISVYYSIINSARTVPEA